MTTRHSRQGGSVLLCLLTAVLLAGCGGADQADPKPSFSPQPTAASSSSSPVSTSSSASPVQETPEAFVRRWNALSTEMQNTGRTTDYKAVSEGCDACSKTAELVDHYYAGGGFIRTGGWALSKLRCGKSTASRVQCTADVTSQSTKYRTSEASAVKTFPGGQFAEVFEMTTINNVWTMTYIAQQAS